MSQLWSGHEHPDYQGISATNQFISNFQIPVTRKTDNPKRYYWKERAVAHGTKALGQLISEGWCDQATFVPIPPSNVNGDAEHDPRLLVSSQATTERYS